MRARKADVIAQVKRFLLGRGDELRAARFSRFTSVIRGDHDELVQAVADSLCAGDQEFRNTIGDILLAPIPRTGHPLVIERLVRKVASARRVPAAASN